MNAAVDATLTPTRVSVGAGRVRYLAGSAWLDVGAEDVLGSPLQAEVVRGLSVLLTGQIELQILFTEL